MSFIEGEHFLQGYVPSPGIIHSPQLVPVEVQKFPWLEATQKDSPSTRVHRNQLELIETSEVWCLHFPNPALLTPLQECPQACCMPVLALASVFWWSWPKTNDLSRWIWILTLWRLWVFMLFVGSNWGLVFLHRLTKLVRSRKRMWTPIFADCSLYHCTV